MRIVDTKGQQCPAPLIETKRALKETKTGESFKVITNSQNALNNISRFLKDNKTEFWIEEKESIWTITITKANTSAGNIIRP
jgi:TusA-related sulfurtransferase